MSEAISTRAFLPTDLEEVVEVMRLGLGESPGTERSARMFEWKHLKNPFGDSLVLLAEAGRRIVGLRAFMRWNLIDEDGHLIRCVRAVDTATLPEFRRLGIFRRLTMEAVEEATLDGTHLVFNTPNPTSKAGYMSMGWREVGWVPLLLRPRLRAVLSKTKRSELAQLPPVFRVPSFAILDRPPRGLRTPRSNDYLTWRFTRHPTAEYHGINFDHCSVVVRTHRRKNRSELVISDMFGQPTAESVRRTVSAAKTDYAVTSFAKGSPERRAVLRAGFVPVRYRAGLFLVFRPLVDVGRNLAETRAWDFAISDLELL